MSPKSEEESSRLDPKQVEDIYEQLPTLVLELDPDPVHRGPDYLQDAISKVRGMLNTTGVYLQRVLRFKAFLDKELLAASSSFEVASNDLMATDERVSRLPAVQDRIAMTNVILRRERRDILEKEQAVQEVTYLEKAVRHRHKELESTMSAIRLQTSLFKADIRTGAFYGDENSKSRGDDVADSLDPDEIDRLMEESESEVQAETDSIEDADLNLEDFLGSPAPVEPKKAEKPKPEPKKAEKPKSRRSKKELDLEDFDLDLGDDLLICSVCGETQYDTPGGLTCKNGHGGAPSKDPSLDGDEPEAPIESQLEVKPEAEPLEEDPDVSAFLDEEDDFADVLNDV